MVFTPTWLENGMDVIRPECRAAIQAQIVEGGFDWVVGNDNPYPVPDHRNVLYQYQAAREKFLAGDWNALVFVEHDVVLPDAGAVQRLVMAIHESPLHVGVVYGVYVLRHGIPVLNAWRYDNDRNLGMPLDQYPDELRRARAATTWRVSGVGFGITAIRRAVVERIEFHSGENQICPDTTFAEDALRAGIVSLARFDVLAEHIDDGRVLRPFEVMEKMRYMALETVNAIAADRYVRLVAGQEIELSLQEASEMVNVGYVRPVEAAHLEPVEQAVTPAQRRRKGRKAA